MKDLQERINIALEERNLGPSINVSKAFDQPTREAIKRIQRDLYEAETGEIRPALDKQLGVR